MVKRKSQTPKQDTGWLDSLSTGELYAFLQQDEQDAEIIAAASRLLDAREQESVPSVDAAWESFQRDYLPLAEQGETLCDPEPEPKRKRRFLSRAVGIAAALSIVLFAGFLIPAANGSSAWETFVLWTKDTFGIRGAAMTERVEYPEELTELRQLLEAHDHFQANLLPQWLPEGYTAGDTRCDIREDTSVFFTMLQREPDEIIMLFYRTLGEDGVGSTFEKNEAPPEEYVVHGVTHFLFQNVDLYTAVWQAGDLECSIQNAPDRDDLLRMIDSIYGE